ncbi:MAG: DUF6480 family protein [Mycobacterium sp.]
MTALPPDPDPANTSVAAGGVEPGDTPPDSAQTSASANQDPPPRSRFTPAMIAAMVAVGIFFAVFLTISVLYFLQAIGVMPRW